MSPCLSVDLHCSYLFRHENGALESTEQAGAEKEQEYRKGLTQTKAALKNPSACCGLQELLGLRTHLRVFNEIRVNSDMPVFMLIQLITFEGQFEKVGGPTL